MKIEGIMYEGRVKESCSRRCLMETLIAGSFSM